MLRRGPDALVRMDVDLAYEVCRQDDEVDQMHRQTYTLAGKMMKEGSEDVGTVMHLMSVSRNLERIADHATNIAEDVIYMISGQIIRHQSEKGPEAEAAGGSGGEGRDVEEKDSGGRG